MKNTQRNYYIYKVTCTKNGKCYIGQTVNPKHRFYKCHQNNPKLMADIEKYGIESFMVEIIARTTDRAFASSMEQHFVDEFNSIENGYNRTRNFHGAAGLKRTEKANAKRRESISKTIWMTNPATGQTTRANPLKASQLELHGWIRGRVKPDGYFQSSPNNKLFPNVSIPSGNGDYFKIAQ